MLIEWSLIILQNRKTSQKLAKRSSTEFLSGGDGFNRMVRLKMQEGMQSVYCCKVERDEG